MIHVIATIETLPGRRKDLLAIFAKLVPQVRAEAGCIEYTAAVDVPSGLEPQLPLRDDVVTVIEKWESLSALKAHLATPHMADFRQQTQSLRKSLTLQVLGPA